MVGSISQSNNEPAADVVFAFRPLARSDFPMMQRWLLAPAIVAWWDPPPQSVHDVEREYGPVIDGTAKVNGLIVEYGESPVGFIQWYRLSDHPDYAGIDLAPDGAAGIDLFIGEDDYRHRGLGAPMIRAFLRDVLFAHPDITACAIDPVVANTSAISAYRRAGFRDAGIRYNAYEKSDSLIMLITRADLSRDTGV